METEKQIIEIKGIKMELDHRTAELRRIDTFSVGQPIKLLMKTYSGHEVKTATIVGFEDFKALPSIAVAYLESSGELKITYVNDKSEHEIIPTQPHDLNLNREMLLDGFERNIARKELELKEAVQKRNFFIEMFAKHFARPTVNA